MNIVSYLDTRISKSLSNCDRSCSVDKNVSADILVEPNLSDRPATLYTILYGTRMTIM